MNTSGEHILSSFNEALSQLKEETLFMGATTQRNFENALTGLLQRDKTLCNQAIVDDEDVDQMEVRIDTLSMEIILKFQPVAGDLRSVIASMKMVSNIERISDQAVNIAKKARKILKTPEIPEVARLEPLYHHAAQMLSNVLKAYSDSNTDLALSIIESEEELKKTQKLVSRFFSSQIESQVNTYRDYLDLLFICRWIERVGNLAVNIAEDIIFEETSTDIRHGRRLPSELA